MKSGFAVLVGRSNVGKSTLLNSLVGSKIAITTRKPQTTRFSVHGIVHDPRGQIVFVDTPGIFERAHDVLTKTLNDRVRDALRDIDVVVYVADPTRPIGNEENIMLRLVEPIQKPKILAINKIDAREVPYIEEYRALAPRFNTTIDISALRNKNLKQLVDAVLEALPEGEPFYPE
ncbi:GTPase Era, partial [Candidatus Uhrbacteria bacterium]|nr:GTPase Era [Candidatus Uhrbacteria bacterium]